MKKNLIIHPSDPTTRFLSPIYAPLKNKTVIEGGISQPELKKLILDHDRIIMLGHGSPHGLLSVDQFPEQEYLVIHGMMVGELWHKIDSIYIWCMSDIFLMTNVLNGICCSMFISELAEGLRFGFKESDLDFINESNEYFSSIMARHINEPNDELFRNLMSEYGELAKRNPIAAYNHKGLGLINTSMKERELLMFCDDDSEDNQQRWLDFI
jgi:hypothetical protein